MRKSLVLILFLLCAASARAQCTGSGTTWNCPAGATSAQVETVLTTASDGATVTFAPGTYTATATNGGVAWAFSNSIGVTLVCATAPTLANGATQDPTPVTTMGFHNKLVGAASVSPCVLNLGSNTLSGAIGMTTASGTNSHFYRISGMTLDCNGFTPTAGIGGLINFSAVNGTSATMKGPGPAFNGGVRIDHNTFRNCPAATQNIVFGDTSANTLNISGVIDHNYWTGAHYETIVEWPGGRPATYSGSGIGTLNNIFGEDNFFNFAAMDNQSAEGCTDGQWGDTHMVWRFNHSLDCAWAFHAPVPSVMMYWNLIEFDANATGMIPGCGSINGCRAVHHQGTGEFIAFSNIFKLPSGNAEAGDPIVNQDYRQHAGVGAWTKPTSYTVSGGNTTIVVPTGMFGGACTGATGGFSRFCFWVTRGFTNSANNAPFNPFVAATTPTSGVSASLAGEVTETVTNGIIGADDNAEMYPCDGTISSAPVGYDGSNAFTSITDGNRSPSATWFGYPCAMQPGRSIPAPGTVGVYSPNVFVGNTWFNTGNAAHGLIENPSTGTVPNAFPPTNCGTATTLTVVCDYFSTHLLANREWFVNFGTIQTSPTAPWDGTFTQHPSYGAGYGTLANRPATCVQSSENAFGGSAGGMYLATDQGSAGADGVTPMGVIYTCGSSGTWVVYNTPVQYPHPLVASSSQVATPTFSPAAGSYLSPQTVTITSATGAATICYTNDGTVPTTNGAGTCTHGTTLVNGGTVSVTFTQLLQAIGTESGFTDSAIASAQYTFTTITPGTSFAGMMTSGGQAVMQ